ncbi:hypothetical protein ED733_003547 [Metarhizium rileyi]|uniref:Uncharacterized protein n=1 Tax=Metarhizium rileyi (strain RCEF 4871) TaxID=1649241 RepID=A0A5C6G5G2_METRR|nr:hypothetical protein ED733_003547 [Metarhizium rileyi]
MKPLSDAANVSSETHHYPSLDVYTAMNDGPFHHLHDSHAAYRSLVSRLEPKCGSLNAYAGRVAFYHLLSLSSTRHLAFGLAALFSCDRGMVAIGNHQLLDKYSSSSTTVGLTHTEIKDDSPHHVILLLERSELGQATLLDSSAATLAQLIVSTLLTHLSGNADPIHLVTQNLLLSGLTDAQYAELDRCIWADQLEILLTPLTGLSPEQEAQFMAFYEAEELAASRKEQVNNFRTLMLKDMRSDFGKTPNFCNFYFNLADKVAHEFDAVIITVHIFRDTVYSSKFHLNGYNHADPKPRALVRVQSITWCMGLLAGMTKDVVPLPRIHAWYNEHIRPAFEQLTGNTGISESEGESPVDLLARRDAVDLPHNDNTLRDLLFTPESLEYAYDPFAALYHAAKNGDVEQAIQANRHTRMRLADSEACSLMLAAIQGKHLKMIDWLLNEETYFRDMPEAIVSAALVGDDVLLEVMKYSTDPALEVAFCQAGARRDQPEQAVSRLLGYLGAHRRQNLSIYFYAMDTAAAYDDWQHVATFLDILVKPENSRDLRDLDQKVISCIIKKAKDPDMRRKLCNLLDYRPFGQHIAFRLNFATEKDATFKLR